MIGLEYPLQFQKRLVVKNKRIQVVYGGFSKFQTKSDGLYRKGSIVLDPAKPLFLRGRNDLPIFDDGGSRIMEESRDPEYQHNQM